MGIAVNWLIFSKGISFSFMAEKMRLLEKMGLIRGPVPSKYSTDTPK